MTEPAAPFVPTGIRLHKKSRTLEIAFPDDTRFMYPCEYLRVFAPASRGQVPDRPVHGKHRVEITLVKAQGETSLQLEFDDGFSGSYSWETLHALGVDYEGEPCYSLLHPPLLVNGSWLWLSRSPPFSKDG